MGRIALLILVLLALALGGGALYVLRDSAGTSAVSSVASSGTAPAALGAPVLPQLKAADVARITIREPKASLTLEKKSERWVIAERGGYPADLDRVTELVVKAIELKVGQSESIGEQDRARMQLAAPVAVSAASSALGSAATSGAVAEGAATAVVFAGADGKTLAELWLGKKYFKTAPEGDATKALGDGRFVMLPADATRVIIVSDPLKQATADAKEWVAKDGIAIENLKAIEVKGPEVNYKLSRAILDTPWQLDGKGGTLDASRAGAAANALTRLEIEDVAAAGAATDTAAGFDQGHEITASTYDGLDYRLKLGRLEGTRYFVQVTVEGEAKRLAPSAPPNDTDENKEKRDKAFAEETKRFNERIAREKALAPFTVMMAKAKFDDLLKQREALLTQEKKDAKPAAKKLLVKIRM